MCVGGEAVCVCVLENKHNKMTNGVGKRQVIKRKMAVKLNQNKDGREREGVEKGSKR